MTLAPGFTDPTRQAQHAFRAILDALAHPTRRYPIVGPAQPPPPLGPAAAAVALTLCDEQTPIWLDAPLAAGGAVAGWLAFHTGAPVVTDARQAAFVFATAWDRVPSWGTLAAGTHEQPQQSATVVLDTSTVDITVAGGTDRTGRWWASGPGIDGRAELVATWAPAGFAEVWQANTARFPLGVDLVVADGGRVLALPRTTTLTEVD